MRRIARLALSVWIAVTITIALSALFWRIEYLRPHGLWGLLSVLTITAPLLSLTLVAAINIIRGQSRLRAVGWLLIGVTPAVWIGAYFIPVDLSVRARKPIVLNTPLRVAMVWVSSIMDLEARWRYPRWTRGKHALLMDHGQTQDADRLVTEMDEHIEAMAGLLGQAVPETEFPWVRGPLIGHNGRAIARWALCGHTDDPAELTYLDRHEVAHTLITALAGPDQDPPFLLLEGWAESQSSDRSTQIQQLAQKHRDGQTYSLQELVGSHWYGRGSGPVYWQGGPLAHYLMHRYSPEVFFQLYTGVRCDSFHDDCQRILGDSWAEVERGFWQWVESEATILAKSNPAPPDAKQPVRIEFSDDVDPADWQSLVDGYQNSNPDSTTLPRNSSFVAELEQNRGATDKPGTEQSDFEFRAVFENGDCWIFENYFFDSERFLIDTSELCAILSRDSAGKMSGWTTNGERSSQVRHEAMGLLTMYRNESDPDNFLPIGTRRVHEGTFRIESLIRPTDGESRSWTVGFTKRFGEKKLAVRYRLTLSPDQRWWITHLLAEREGAFRTEVNTEYQQIGDVVMPLTYSSHSVSGESNNTAKMTFRPLSETERREVRRRVEQACQSAPTDPFERMRWILLAVAIACPVIGLACLGLGR